MVERRAARGTPKTSTGSTDARLVRVPTDGDLGRMYVELAARGGSAMGRHSDWPYAPGSDEMLLCLGAEMARHDPRLLGVLIEVVLARWRSLSPMSLRDAMRTMRSPQAMCVVATFAGEASNDRELTHWVRHVCAEWPAAQPAEQFFVDDVRPHERSAGRRLGRSLRELSIWGFYGTERPTFNAHQKRRVGRYDARTRRDILRDHLEREPGGVTLADYLELIDHSVSRQSALGDLRALGLVAETRGPGARWRPPRTTRPAKAKRAARGSEVRRQPRRT